MNGTFARVVRAIRLDPSLYRQVADDDEYLTEAFLIVIVVAILGALGVGLGGQRALTAFIVELVNSVVFGWLLWALIAFFVGDMLGGRSSFVEMARTLGYANAPRLLAIFGFLPCVGWVFRIAAWGLSVAAGVIAVRESMEFDTTKAIITSVVGLAIYIIANALIGITLGRVGLF